MRNTLLLLLSLFISFLTFAQDETEEKDPLNAGNFSALKFRNLGPALTSGRIADLAVNPQNPNEYYVAVASGGVWKTSNGGTTYQPIFDEQDSYSIGCVTLDPNNSNVVWVGTGENNNQRSVAFGNGVYKSTDGGKSWKNMGLKNSEHIGMIAVDPSNSNRVFVAAYGPLWSAGGDRGLYLTEDGGENWKKILDISEHTGVNEVHLDPRNPDIIYAAAHQRRRHVFTYISGGPESAVYKSTNGGESFEKLTNGLPKGDVGRIGLDISPVNPDVIYAIIEGEEKAGGFYRSNDRGASWKRLNDYTTSGNYYVEIFCDPKDVDKVYSMDTYCHFTDDGGKTFQRLNEKYKHVDNHCMWINPQNTDHYLMGCDGGIYETFDNAQTWEFKANLPVTQFYRVSVDNDEPFYNIYGGTQDNFSMGGPSQNTSASGIPNSDWFITKGGDGFETVIDPKDPNIVYAQSQYGWLVRFDKASGEKVDIKPYPTKDEEAFRWNWDAPLIISPHNHKRLYFAANKLFMSNDRGNTWQRVSPDLTQQIDRNKLPVMGKVWSMDAVSKNRSTTIYGNIVALDESPVKEGLLYVGTDDGLIQVSEDNGQNWRKLSDFPGVPENTYVNFVKADLKDENVVYAGFNNHKNGDFKPYLLKSIDKGQTWKPIAGDLPERGSVFSFAQDHIDLDLFFVGTEFGVFFSPNGGEKWIQLKGGIPTIAIRDLELQRRENDLVLASFGRGFYVLDNYAPLRNLTADTLEKEAHLFPIEDALAFIESYPLGRGENSFQGHTYYAAPNPEFGATFTFYLKEAIKTQKQLRQEKEKELTKEEKDIPYPSFEAMRAEDNEAKPFLLFTITDEQGNVVNRVKAPASKGMQRITWNLRYPSLDPVNPKKLGEQALNNEPKGPLVAPGRYFVAVSKSENGTLSPLINKKTFEVVPLGLNRLAAEDQKMVLTFQKKVRELNRAVDAARKVHRDMEERLAMLKEAALNTQNEDLSIWNELNALQEDMQKVDIALNGDKSLSSREFEIKPSISSRVGVLVWYLYNTTSAPTATQRENYRIAGDLFKDVLRMLNSIQEKLNQAHDALEKAKGPYVPGKIPEWDF